VTGDLGGRDGCERAGGRFDLWGAGDISMGAVDICGEREIFLWDR
jgi:hypothetical protein